MNEKEYLKGKCFGNKSHKSYGGKFSEVILRNTKRVFKDNKVQQICAPHMLNILFEPLQTLLKKYSSFEKAEINKTAFSIARNWYKHPTLKKILTYKGIPLGRVLECEVISVILPILISHWKKRQ